MTGPALTRISGALAEARPLKDASLYELMRVGHRGLLGEVIRVAGDTATLQVYEDTTGLETGEPVTPTGAALSLELGPGLLGSILDGAGRPLSRLAELSGDFIAAGAAADTLDQARQWDFAPAVRAGDSVAEGDVLGTIDERPGTIHRVMVPPGVRGTVAEIRGGARTVAESIGRLEDGTPLRLAHRWPVRERRPVARRLGDDRPFITGQRVFDLLFPVAEGGTVAVPGGFGTGKTVIEQSLARHGLADIVVYIGCGERGNEMAEVLHEFPRLVDPRTGHSIMDRTIMVVNTSNMPVAAREASVYVGITIAEYYRDMGYRVALLADSLSRWAEALREISSRLGEMPGEEGYPTYLANRLGRFYERAGRVETCGRPEREGALTLVAAISPPGGDFSEPVTQATLRVAGALWALDPALAHQRHYPAVDWDSSWSLYAARVTPWFARETAPDWGELRARLLELLQRGREMKEIAGLVGPEALQDADRLLLDTTQLVRDVVLGQSAYDPNDASSSITKTYRLAALADRFYRVALEVLGRGVNYDTLDLGPLRHALAAVRGVEPSAFEDAVHRASALIDRLDATGGTT